MGLFVVLLSLLWLWSLHRAAQSAVGHSSFIAHHRLQQTISSPLLTLHEFYVAYTNGRDNASSRTLSLNPVNRDMEQDKKIELVVKIVSPLLTLLAVIVGIWQFNSGQSALKEREIAQRNFELSKMNNEATIEAVAKFKERQTGLYIETCSIISYLIVNKNFTAPQYREKLERFWQLYWVELSAVETEEVERAMVNFGNVLTELQNNNFSNFQEHEQDFIATGYKVAKAIKISARTWEPPDGLIK